MVDMLASRKGEEEALCAICADGTSVDPNVIVFCERCDMAVHQLCYGIEQIPSGAAARPINAMQCDAVLRMPQSDQSQASPALRNARIAARYIPALRGAAEGVQCDHPHLHDCHCSVSITHMVRRRVAVLAVPAA